MANILKIKSSNVALREPTSLEYGELAINYRDGKLFYKDANNVIKYFNSDLLESTVEGQTLLINYKYSLIQDLKDLEIRTFADAIPPYLHGYKYYSEIEYYPQANTFINNSNIDSIEKLNVGEYKLNFVSNFGSNTYSHDLVVTKFDDFGESPNFAIVSEKANNYVIVKTGRTNINDVNLVDRYDVSEFKIKLYE